VALPNRDLGWLVGTHIPTTNLHALLTSNSVYGTCLCWYNVLNATTSSILSAAPYSFSSGLVGTAYLSPLIAAGLGAVWSGWSTDKLAIRLARRNYGIREPEQRLWALLLSGVLCSAGLILWGVGSARDIHWFGAIFGLGLLAFSVICGASITLSYAVDSFKASLFVATYSTVANLSDRKSPARP
jgi:hypothetical protein